ncbi:MAG: HAD family hydrolase [Maricaulaceae bacterium]
MWSGPRNLSTAMMRSFGARADTAVWDEPFFAPFLAASGKDHPGREETLAAHDRDPQSVARDCALPPPNGERYFFQKHMPHHMLEGFPMDWAKTAKHFFLIRDPRRVIASYIKGRAEFDLDDLGYRLLREFHETLTEMTGTAPPILDCTDILTDPEKRLTSLCGALAIPFDKAMLKWEKGSRPTDGAWAPYWYASVQDSTGFAPPPKTVPELHSDYMKVLNLCQADYAALYEMRERAA